MMRFVPEHSPPNSELVERLANMLLASSRSLILTGAGLSTESGLPDYRSERVGLYARTDRKPIEYRTFITDAEARKRYWARNFVGWSYFSSAKPNNAHKILAKWDKEKRLCGLITQNVDRLHHLAGANRIMELHGTTHRVVCLHCGYEVGRNELQQRFVQLNPSLSRYGGFAVEQEHVSPDGDIELSAELIRNFQVPDCPRCGSGILKPDVVFFGENLPLERKNEAASLVSKADLLLCLGTSVQTFSAFRLLLQANQQRTPIAIVNIGPTRGDSLAQLIINSKISSTLEQVDRLIRS